MDNKEHNIIFSNDLYQLIEKGGNIGIRQKSLVIMVIPFVCDKKGLPLYIGIEETENLFREAGKEIGLIKGFSSGDDPDLLTTAKKILKEKTGKSMDDLDKWYYLGSSTASSFVDMEYPCFGVDLTEIYKEDEKETKKNNFKWISSDKVMDLKNIFVLGYFLKLFKYVMNIDIITKEQKDNSSKSNRNEIEL